MHTKRFSSKVRKARLQWIGHVLTNDTEHVAADWKKQALNVVARHEKRRKVQERVLGCIKKGPENDRNDGEGSEG